MRDIFWYIDGHHHVFERVQKPISTVFSSFIDYNCPKRYKHAKRVTSNLSSDKLREFAFDLSTILLESYWDRDDWKSIKQHFIDLCLSFSSYSDHLVLKNKRMKRNHKSPTPVREVSDHLVLKYLCPSSELLSSSLLQINGLVSSLPPYNHSNINHLLPSDSLQKHRLVESLISSGLSFPAMLLIYSPGGSLGNLHFMWPVPQQHDDDVATYFEKSVRACLSFN